MEDLISRETMKDVIDITTWYHQNRNKDMVEGASDEETAWFKAKDVFKAIENVPSEQPETCPYWDRESNFCALHRPSAQPERKKKGKWIKNDNGTYSCDQCHSWIPNEQHYYARYCIFCGAPMEVEE